MQPSLPIEYLYQPARPNDTAIQFAPFNATMLIHRKASEESGLRATKTGGNGKFLKTSGVIAGINL